MKKEFLLLLFVMWMGSIFSQSTTTFNYTGGVQTYTVPPCVTQLEVVVAGAQGGGNNGGNGATVTATIDVTPGQILEIYVGGQGGCPGNGYNGGGQGPNASGAGNAACGGGGGSDIRITPYGLVDRIVVAGGGGGMSGGDVDDAGGAGGCASGETGATTYGAGATGGTQTNGGYGGDSWGSGNIGSDGTLGNGANGAVDPCYNTAPGGGGGGGYYGGGSGGSDCWSSPTAIGGGGGGGGSSLTPAGGNCTPGNNTGDGYVTITPNNTGMDLEVTPESSEICVGGSVDITATGAVNYLWSPDIGLNTTNGETVTASPPTTQTYLITADDGVDCSDTISVTVTVLPEPVIEITPSSPEICPGESVDLTASGAGTYSWSPANGLNNTSGANVSASPNNTQTYTVTGTSGECTADTTVTVTVNDPPDISYFPTNPELCPDGSVQISASGGETFSWSPTTGLDDPTDSVVTASPDVTTTYTITGTDSDGCTNTVDVTATVLSPPDVDAGEDLEICPETGINLNGSSTDAVSYSWFPALSLDDPTIADPFAFPDVTTTYTLEITDANGCTNTDEVTVEVIDESYETITEASICEGETYTLPDGQSVDESGEYENMFTSVLGCDSVVITELTVNPVYDLSEMVEFCEGETFELPDGTDITTSGSYTVDLVTVAGCDSAVTFDLIFNPVYEETIDASICETQSYTMPDGSEESTEGSYTFDFTTISGCDSIIHVDLSVQETIVIPQDVSICDNESYTLPDGSVVNDAGTYDVVIGSGGCDTLYQVEVSVNPTFESTVEVSICDGEQFTLPDGSTESSSGTYTIAFNSAAGCDSIVNYDLEVLAAYDFTQTVNICDGEFYSLEDGTEVDETGIYEQLFTAVNGCDSIVSIDLTVRPDYDMDVLWQVCDNDNPLDPFGNPVTGDTEVFLEYTSIYGCDSLVHVQIEYHEAYTDTTEVSFCSGNQYITSAGQVITSAGIHQDNLVGEGGCDSILVYEVVAFPAPVSAYSTSLRVASIYDDPVQFFNESVDADSLEWDFGIHGTSQQANPIIDFGDVPGFYPICLYTWNQYGCSDIHCFEYEVREDFAVYIPNAFSPNGDGINDLFFVQGKDIDPQNFLLQIFNRNGEIVFETTDPDQKWDGGEPAHEYYAQNEVYVYRIVIGSLATSETKEFTGNVTAIR